MAGAFAQAPELNAAFRRRRWGLAPEGEPGHGGLGGGPPARADLRTDRMIVGHHAGGRAVLGLEDGTPIVEVTVQERHDHADRQEKGRQDQRRELPTRRVQSQHVQKRRLSDTPPSTWLRGGDGAGGDPETEESA